MTRFGDTMKEKEAKINELGLVTKKEADKKNNKAREYEYKFEVSGVDMVATRVLNGKDTSKLYIYLSKEFTDGTPMMFIEDKKGTMLEFDEKSYLSFVDGLGHKDQFPSGYIDTGSDIIPKLRKYKEFVNMMVVLSRSKGFAYLLKKRFITTEIIYSLMESSSWNADYDTPWYFRNVSYSLSYSNLEEKNIDMDAIHEKLLNYIVEDLQERYEITRYAALAEIYGRRRGVTKMNSDAIEFFIMLSNVYDEPFAIKCYHEYIDNVNLDKVDSESLGKVLLFSPKGYYNQYGGYNDSVPYSRLLRNYDPKILENCIKFEKNRLWEYIQHAICVGRGSNLKNYMDLWSDYLRFAYDVDGKIKEKYPDAIQVAHDVYDEEYNKNKSFRDAVKLEKQTAIADKVCTIHGKTWELLTLLKQKDYLDEAKQNSNCVAGYTEKTIKGKSWICSFRPTGSDTTVLTVEVDPSNGRMVQVLGKYNRSPTNAELKELKKFQRKVFKNFEKEGHIDVKDYYKVANYPSIFANIYDDPEEEAQQN